MATAYKSIFDTADWIAALDRQLAAPPAPPPAEAEPEIADEAFAEPLPTWDAQPAAKPKRRVRNLPWAILATCAAMIYMLLVVTAFDAPLWLLTAALAACVLLFVLWLLAAWRWNRL